MARFNRIPPVSSAVKPSALSGGRPSVLEACGLGAHDVAAIKRIALTAGRWTDCVSMSMAVRQYAGKLEAAHPFRLWCEARHSKHHIPESLIAALGFQKLAGGGRGGRLVAHDQAPGRERLKYEASAPGCLRRRLDGSLYLPGECESWDDLSHNFIFWHVIDGKVHFGRFQCLAGLDQRSDFWVGSALIARAKESYRGEDAGARAMLPTWRTQGAPKEIVTERATWEAGRMLEFYQATGVNRRKSYHPRTKLVESGFNRLHTWLGDMPGSIGRSRGENEYGTKLLASARRRGEAACGDFLEIGAAYKRICAAMNEMNHDPVESRLYGKWIPAELWSEQAAANRRPLPEGLGWLARSERAVITVRRDGTVRPRLTDAFDITHEFAFGWADGWKHAGSMVVVYFNGEPAMAALEGAVVLAADGKTVLTAKADALAGNAMAAVELRRAANQSVRAEHRVLRPDGTLKAWQSEIKEQSGLTLRSMQSGGEQSGQATEWTETDTGRNACATTAAEQVSERVTTLRAPRRASLSAAEIDAAFELAALGL